MLSFKIVREMQVWMFKERCFHFLLLFEAMWHMTIEP